MSFGFRIEALRVRVLTPFAITLRSLRLKRGLRQFELAERLSVSAAYLSLVESGRESPPGADFLRQVVTLLELSSDECDALKLAAQRSHRRFTLGAHMPTDHIELVNILVDRLPMMRLTDIRRIREVVDAAGTKSA